MQRSVLCRSRREFSNEYLLAKIGVDTAENEPLQVCPLSVYRSPRLTGLAELIANFCQIFDTKFPNMWSYSIQIQCLDVVSTAQYIRSSLGLNDPVEAAPHRACHSAAVAVSDICPPIANKPGTRADTQPL